MSFSEFNSPTYTFICLEDLSHLEADIHDEECKRLAHELSDLAWVQHRLKCRAVPMIFMLLGFLYTLNTKISGYPCAIINALSVHKRTNECRRVDITRSV